MGSRARRAIAEAMAATPDDAPRVVLATGRFHRLHAGEAEVLICDYVDEGVPVLARMYQCGVLPNPCGVLMKQRLTLPESERTDEPLRGRRRAWLHHSPT